METYPENLLPLPSANFGVESVYSNVRSRMDSGRTRQRPRFPTLIETAGVEFDLTRREYALFKAFLGHRLNNANDWFNMRLPVANDETLTLVEVRFITDVGYNHRNYENWRASATIEFRDTTILSEDILAVEEVKSFFGNDGTAFVFAMDDFGNELAHFVNLHNWRI